MSDANANPPTIAGQPIWVVIAAAVVAVLVIGGGAWWFTRGHQGMTTATAKRPALVGMLGDSMTALDTTAPAQDKLCSTTLARALDFGVVPAGATWWSQDAQRPVSRTVITPARHRAATASTRSPSMRRVPARRTRPATRSTL